MKLQLISTAWQSCFTKFPRFICPLNLKCLFPFLLLLPVVLIFFLTLCFQTYIPLQTLHSLPVMLFLFPPCHPKSFSDYLKSVFLTPIKCPLFFDILPTLLWRSGCFCHIPGLQLSVVYPRVLEYRFCSLDHHIFFFLTHSGSVTILGMQ